MGKSTFLFEPTPSKSLSSTTTTKDYVILEALEDVRTSLIIWKKDGEKWALQEAPKDGASVPTIGSSYGIIRLTICCDMTISVYPKKEKKIPKSKIQIGSVPRSFSQHRHETIVYTLDMHERWSVRYWKKLKHSVRHRKCSIGKILKGGMVVPLITNSVLTCGPSRTRC